MVKKKGLLLVLLLASFSSLGAWKTKGHWVLSEGEIIGGAALAGLGAGGLGFLVAFIGASADHGPIRFNSNHPNFDCRDPAILSFGALIPGLPAAIFVYWKLGKLKAKKQCEVASEQIAKLLANEIIFPLEAKEKTKIDVSED
ncbi:hypothetical protein KAU11_01240, partial [Candidatus Babeliales bacterium]|nr:hypothetical protein [Candidatus Babeliales bacterium]